MSNELLTNIELELGDELSEYDLYQLYDDFLDELYPDCSIAGYVYNTSEALKNCDPTAYKITFDDWLDSMVQEEQIIRNNGKYYQPI